MQGLQRRYNLYVCYQELGALSRPYSTDAFFPVPLAPIVRMGKQIFLLSISVLLLVDELKSHQLVN